MLVVSVLLLDAFCDWICSVVLIFGVMLRFNGSVIPDFSMYSSVLTSFVGP